MSFSDIRMGSHAVGVSSKGCPYQGSVTDLGASLQQGSHAVGVSSKGCQPQGTGTLHSARLQ